MEYLLSVEKWFWSFHAAEEAEKLQLVVLTVHIAFWQTGYKVGVKKSCHRASFLWLLVTSLSSRKDIKTTQTIVLSLFKLYFFPYCVPCSGLTICSMKGSSQCLYQKCKLVSRRTTIWTEYVTYLDHKILWKLAGCLELHIYTFSSWTSNPDLVIL